MTISRRVRVLVVGLVASVAVLTLLFWPIYQSRTDQTWQNAVAAIVEDHARGLHHDSLTTSDPGAARDWLSARVGLVLHVPQVSGVVLERVEICRLDGRRACLLRYRADGRAVSFYSYRLTPTEQAASQSVGSVSFHEEEGGRYRVVLWEEEGWLRALVADLPQDKLLALARACRSPRSPS